MSTPSKHQVLVVDDDPSVRETVALLLMSAGYDVAFGTLAQLLRTAPARRGDHHRQLAPAWIPRNGNDSQGIPYVVVACAGCLRTFQVTVVEETTGEVLEIPCRFCPNTNKYIIEPSSQGMRELFA